MRRSYPFLADDLESLDELLSKASAVVPMKDVYFGYTASTAIAVRHDVDDNEGSFQAALQMANWEAVRGYRSTYFLLHTASYWNAKGHNFGVIARHMESLGHEVGIHVNSIAEAVRTGVDPAGNLRLALNELRWDVGVGVVGAVAHGDELCKDPDVKGKYRFVNDEMFEECARPEMGAPDRIIKGTNVKIDPLPLLDFGLLYDSNRLPRKFYASDSGGNWSQPWEQTVAEGISSEGQLHLLIHPDWWTEAF